MLKKEVRILGLSAPTKRKEPIPVIGVIFRGSLWLDGIFTCLLKRKRGYLSALDKAIIQSKQYSQLRAVILSRKQLIPGEDLDITELASRINLPVLSLIKNHHTSMTRLNGRPARSSTVSRYSIVVNGKTVWVLAAGVSFDETRQIFAVSCAENYRIPEAVRVADLIARRVSREVLRLESSKA